MKKLLILLLLLSFNIFAEPVNINKADAKAIASALKGIGPAKADAIVKYRTKNGSFKSIDDLRNVPGIGEKILSNIAADVGLSGSISKKSAPAKASKTKDKAAKKDTKKESEVAEKPKKSADKPMKKVEEKTEKKATKEKSSKKKEKKPSKKSKDKKAKNKSETKSKK